MEKCHLCGKDLDYIETIEWREDVKEKKAKEPVWKWKKTTEKTFACGTVKREGDIDDEVKRVTLGRNCVEISL